MQVDFYQRGDVPLEQVNTSISDKILALIGRLIVVGSDEAALARLNRMLWDQGPTSFLPHALAGGADDARQPILLTTSPDAPNLARNILIADGEWREAALDYDRAFHLFDDGTIEQARLAWKLLSGREGVERRYWRYEDGRWTRVA